MSNSVIGALRVNLGLDAAQFQRGAAAAQAAAGSLASRLRVIGVAAAGVATALALAVRGQLNAADDMVKAADRIGVSVETLSRLEHAASLSGVSMQTLQGAMQRLARNAVESASDLHALGIATRDSAGQMRPMEDLLGDVADRLAAMPPGAERTALAIQMLGRQGAELIPMLQGGSAGLRAMAAEADALGLTLSTRTARAAEQFNDNITRLQRQFTGIARLIMAEMVPALVAISDSIVAGVAQVRAMSEAIGGFRGYIAAAAIALTASFVPALYAATVATGAWISSLITLRGVLLATGIGAFVVGAGMAINWLIRLREATGSWAEALGLLGEVARGVWEGIVNSAAAIPAGLAAVWASVQLDFLRLVERLRNAWADFLGGMSDSLRESGLNIGGVLDGAADRLDAAAARVSRGTQLMSGQINDAMAAVASANVEYAGRIEAAWSRLNTAIGAIRTALAGAGAETADTTAALAEMNAALTETENAGGRARNGLEQVRQGAEEVSQAARQVESSFEDAFVSLVTGTKSARQAVADLMRELAKLAAQAAFRQLFGGLFSGGGFFSRLFGGFRANGGPVSPSKAYVVGERGPEMFVPSGAGQIIPNDKIGGGRVELVVHAAPGVTVEQVGQIAAGVSVRVMQSGMAQSRQGLPGSLRDIDLRGT